MKQPFRKNTPVRLTPAFIARHKAFPWLADLTGHYIGLVSPDNDPALSYVLWAGHERPQIVAAQYLERIAP